MYYTNIKYTIEYDINLFAIVVAINVQYESMWLSTHFEWFCCCVLLLAAAAERLQLKFATFEIDNNPTENTNTISQLPTHSLTHCTQTA